MINYKVIISLLSIAVMLFCGSLMYKNNKLEKEISEKELIIVKLEGKGIDQENEIKLLAADNESKKIAIASLETKVKATSMEAQEAIERLIELSGIKPDIENVSDLKPAAESNEKNLMEIKKPNNSVENTNVKTEAKQTGNETDKKFINLRNNIYSRYK